MTKENIGRNGFWFQLQEPADLPLLLLQLRFQAQSSWTCGNDGI